MIKDVKNSLITLGLSEKEASVYLAILHWGKASLSDIAKTTPIKRTTLYLHLDTLLKRGFISKTLKKKRLLYVPENPKKILDNYEKSKNLFLQQSPYLEELYKKATHRPDVRLYEGVEGLVHILHEISESLAPIDAFFSPEKFFRVISKKDSNEFLATIQKNENVLNDLVEFDSSAKEFVASIRRSKCKFHKVKMLPKDFFVAIDILITGKKVAMISFDNLIGIIIENDEIARFHKSIHNFFWKNLT